ncbi:phosphate ABC transporter permease subunit PstC [bacterium]|nr:phosphate ABC transporter permease subunit PstC [bacterium]
MRKTSQSAPQAGLLNFYETAFRWVVKSAGWLVVGMLFGILATVIWQSWPSIREVGWHFYTGGQWDPVFKRYSALPFILGTLLTTFLSLLLAVPIAIGMALFLGYYLRPGIAESVVRSIIDLLAGIPSVIYGFWGLFVLVPVVRSIELKLGIVPYGVGILTSSIILAIMIIPYAASIGRDVVSMVPSDLKEAGLALGATRLEVVWNIILPYARPGILSGILLSFGRAVGETMAVTMVIGNANKIPTTLFDPANTMASMIANEFAEASEPIYISHLVHLSLILFVLTTVVGIIGRYAIRKWSVHS